MFLSVIAAAYNEEDNIQSFVRQTAQALANLGKPWEVIIVNDGSTDRTLEELREMAKTCPQLRIINHRRNFGQTGGWDTAFRCARGEFIATLDADLQNDPADIPGMLELLVRGECDFVNGWRKDRNDPWIRLVSTKIANGFRNWLTKETIHDSACGLKVFRRQCVERVKMYNGMHRFMPTLAKLEGYRVKEIPVLHHPRTAGKSKYGISNRLFRGLYDSFAVRWMKSRVVRPEFDEWTADASQLQETSSGDKA